ncbi:hypothetical protein EUX98_g6931 [Antrodiella citrinella]|uniref:JmjC domain-containing protein n=1 Tax=Antrodiella citrinella TaxID=2447956 RepID=A0A4S4MPT3_9APHY|nr:hypothetical protein EUX98_g6931 [Antrodiella citrinella]
MSRSASSTPSLTPSRSPSPELPVQPDHFYGNDNASAASSPNGKPWLDPADDPLAQRGIPVFTPTMEEFQDFERYMNRLADVKLKSPIEQRMVGHGGLFRQQNVEKRKIMSVREWAELCAQDELRAPGKDDIGLRSAVPSKRKTRKGTKKAKEDAADEQGPHQDVVVVKDDVELEDGIQVPMDVDDDMKQEDTEEVSHASPDADKPAPTPSLDGEPSTGHDEASSSTPVPDDAEDKADTQQEGAAEDAGPRRKGRGRQAGATKEQREAQMAERAAKDASFLESFKPFEDWLPPKFTNEDYTPELCKELERRYWRNCGLGKAPWYGADMQGSLFTDDTKSWNVAHLPSTLSRILPSSNKGLPGVNTPYLYFGMWRATFAWHVEDMDLFSINYIHFGAPKYWYAMPQARSGALEQTMKGYFPRDISQCPQFLRHKSFLASPTTLSASSCRPNTLVQRQGEFVITYPRGYHAGFNLGFNCAESVNFALDSWLDLGRKAKICECVDFSVRIDIDQLLADRAAERMQGAIDAKEEKPKPRSHKRKAIEKADAEISTKKLKIRISKPASSESPSTAENDTFPCCLCVSKQQNALLRVIDPPIGRKEGASGSGSKDEVWMAHEECANVVPETWVDFLDVGVDPQTGGPLREKVVFGVDGIVKDRWNLKCNACTKTKHKAHGAPIQCTKGKCPKAFHVSCARDGGASNIVYTILGVMEKEVILVNPPPPSSSSGPLMVHQQQQLISIQPPQSMTMPMQPMQHMQPFQHPLQFPAGSQAEFGVNPGMMQQQPQQQAPPVKVIKKLEVSVLCSQHNPAVNDAKKAHKQEKIKEALLALPPMTRIKLRVSAGVFEVSLVRVLEDVGCVEVLWDRGIKREFKWGSVVFGRIDEVVGQKPAEPATGLDANLLSCFLLALSFAYSRTWPADAGADNGFVASFWFEHAFVPAVADLESDD